MKAKNAISPCPNPETLAKSFRNELSAGEQESLIDHVLACPECRARFDVLRDVRKEIHSRKRHFRSLAARSRREALAARNEKSGEAGFGSRRILSFAGAALLLILAGVATYSLLAPGSFFPSFRGAGNRTVKLRPPLVLSDGKTILFRWEPYPEADTFYFKFIDNDLNIIRSDSHATAFILDIGKYPSIVPGKSYTWSVEVHNDAGWTIAKAEATFHYKSK